MSEQKYTRVDELKSAIENIPTETRQDAMMIGNVLLKLDMATAYTPAEIMAGQWVPVTEETMPKEPYGCLLIVWDTPYDGGDDCLAYYPGFAGWDGTQWNDSDGQQVPFEVAYWMQLPPLPQPPKGADHDK